MNFARKLRRAQQQKERKAFKAKLVAEGKTIIFDAEDRKFKIVEAKKPYRKETDTQ